MARVRVQVPVDEEETGNKSKQVPDEVQESSEQPAPVARRNMPLAAFIRRNLTSPVRVVMLAVFVLLVVFVVVLVRDRNELRAEVKRLETAAQQKQPAAQNTKEAEDLKKEVGKFIELPKDELPTVATVVDASKVKSQAFFKNAENGDKVLLFAKAGKAILYRPSTQKIVEVAPINLGNSQGSTGTTNN